MHIDNILILLFVVDSKGENNPVSNSVHCPIDRLIHCSENAYVLMGRRTDYFGLKFNLLFVYTFLVVRDFLRVKCRFNIKTILMHYKFPKNCEFGVYLSS